MKHAFYILSFWVMSIFTVFGAKCSGTSTDELGCTGFMYDTKNIFPSPKNLPTDKGIDNVAGFVTATIPLLTTLMAIGAVLMVVLGGFHMVLGGANTEQTEKGKSVIKDAIIGLMIGLLAYVIITTLGNLLDI